MADVSNKRLTQDRFAALYQTYAPLVHARARRLVGDDADDVVQETFMRLLKQRASKIEAGPSAWIYATSTNICIDRIRYRSRRNADWIDQVRHHVRARSDEPEAFSSRLCKQLLTRLDRVSKQILILTYFDEMSQQEVADVLGVSRKTVNTKLKRALEKARGAAQ